MKVDWLNATFDPASLTVRGWLGMLASIMGRPVSGIEGPGLFGFTTGVRLRAYVGGTMVDVGSLAHGGESQRGRWMFQLTGKGCGLVQDWSSLHELLDGLHAKVTRLDLACDFVNGEYTVDDAVRIHGEGGFTGHGRTPSTQVAGDWLDGKRGRTLYVGKGTNGKMLRVYEKGIQLGDPSSPWVRYEVQLGARDRLIPLDALLNPASYFAGCYPALAEMVVAAAQKIPTTQTESEVSLSHLFFHAKRCYGKLFDVLANLQGSLIPEMVEEVRIIGIPRRLAPAGLVSGVTWENLKTQFHQMEANK